MKMKKLLSGFVATTILASSLSLSAFAAVVEGPAINVQASIPNAVAAYGAGATFNVDVSSDNIPEDGDLKGFDMYEFYLKYDSSKVDFTGEKHIDEQGYVDVEKVTVVEGDDLAEYLGTTGDFVHVLYMNEANVDATEVSDLGSYPFAVKADATDGNVEFEVYDFNAGQYAINADDPLAFDVITYKMGDSTPVSATIDTTAPVIDGVNESYLAGDTVSGTVTDISGVSLTLQKGEDEPALVDTPDGVFSIENIEAGSYTLTATDAVGNTSSVTFSVVEAAEKLDVQISTDKTAYKAGDVVNMTITANLDQIAPEGVDTFQIKIPFDNTQLEFVEVGAEGDALEAYERVDADGTSAMIVYMDVENLEPFQGNNLGTYQFKLLDGVESDDNTLTVKAGKDGSMVGIIVDPSTFEVEEYYLEEDAVSNTFMLDSVVPVIEGVVDGTEYGFGETINLKVTDAYLKTVVIDNGESGEALIADNNVVEEALQLLPGNYTITAVDVAGNETVVGFTVAAPETVQIEAEMVGTTTGYPSENGITVNYGSNLMEATNDFGAEAISFDVTYDPAVYDYVGFASDVAGMEVYEYADGYLSVVCFADSEEGMGSFNGIKTDDLVSLQFANVGTDGDTAITTSNVLAAAIVDGGLYAYNVAEVAPVSAVAVSANVDSAFAQVGDIVNVTVSAGADVYDGCSLSGYQFDLVFDTSRFELVLGEGQENYVTLTDTGAKVLYFNENAKGEPIDTDLITLSLQAKDVEGAEGLVNTAIDLANVNLTYESVDNFAIPVCVVGGTEVNVQYAIDEDGLNIVEVPDGDGMVPAVQFPLGTSQEEAEDMLEAAGLDAEITDYGSGNTMTVNGEEMHMIVMGDIDGDGAVTVTDLVAGKAFIFKEADLLAAPQCMQAAMDVDFNGAGNVVDLLKIKLFILNDIETA